MLIICCIRLYYNRDKPTSLLIGAADLNVPMSPVPPEKGGTKRKYEH